MLDTLRAENSKLKEDLVLESKMRRADASTLPCWRKRFSCVS